MIDEGICESEFAASGLINHHVPEDMLKDRDALVAWGKAYRGWRDKDETPVKSAELATAGQVPE